ncbi:zinc ribbon domain-containing protein [uncultured Methanobrevibacter sp.]|uniref:double zinc ribbon domain-containing protein n=1 Tax=uncultured Methanobrevibacter sp. TaxID=253161 RepID=UPI0032089BBF
MIECPNCGKRNSDDNKFCGECGTQLPAPKNYCPECEITFKKGEKFCTQCGNKLVNEIEYLEQTESDQIIPLESMDEELIEIILKKRISDKMTKICPNCKITLGKKIKKCPKCGYKFKK